MQSVWQTANHQALSNSGRYLSFKNSYKPVCESGTALNPDPFEILGPDSDLELNRDFFMFQSKLINSPEKNSSSRGLLPSSGALKSFLDV